MAISVSSEKPWTNATHPAAIDDAVEHAGQV
jgi:hypothetical protein